jgi:hypothetical protein
MQHVKRHHLFALTAYAVLALILTWPLVRQFGSAIPGDSFDGWQNVWNLWWMRESWLVRHASPYFTPILHYPTGVDLRFQTMAPFNGLVTLPIQLTAGLLSAYNSAVLLSFVAGGFGAYLLATYALRTLALAPSAPGKHSPAPSSLLIQPSAFIAGLVYAFSPYHFAHLLGHLQLIALQWIPFYALYLLRGLDRSHQARSRSMLRDGLMAGFFLVLVGLCDWYYVMYCLVFTALALAAWLVKRQLTWRGLGMVAIAGAAFGLALAPLLVPMIQAAATWSGSTLVRSSSEAATLSADLLGFVAPQVFHPLWGERALRRGEAFSATPSEYSVFAGFTVLILALVALIATRKPARRRATAGSPARIDSTPATSPWFWVIAAGVFALLALGPVLKINGRSDLLPTGGQIPLPYALLHRLPFVNLSRSVSRFDVIVMLCLGIAAAFGVAALTLWAARRLPQPAGGSRPLDRVAMAAIPLLAAALILSEFLPAPYPTSPPDTPAWYAELAQDPADLAVLNLPANYERPWYLLYQIEHGKPLATGYVTRDDPRVLRERAPVLSNFWHLGPDIHTKTFDLGRQGMQVLHDLLGVGWVVLDRYKMPGGRERDVTTGYAQEIFAGQTPVYEDERLTVYRVAEPASRAPYTILAPGWSSRQSDETGSVWRDLVAGQPGGLDIVTSDGTPVELAVEAAAPAGGTLRLADQAGETLATWDLSAEPTTLRSGPVAVNSDKPTRVELVYEGPPGAAAVVFGVSINESRAE